MTPEDETTLKFTHLDEKGKARMVDVGQKSDTERFAMAKGRVVMMPSTLELIQKGGVAKGDVLAVARVAGIMGGKRTPDLIPMCHPLLLTHVSLELEPAVSADGRTGIVDITASVKTTGKTGVEMEALTAVSVAALTIYDMCKAVDRTMQIESIRLAQKSGGKSGDIILETG